MSYIYVQKKTNELYNEYFSIFNPPNYATELKGIFDSIEIKKTVNYVPAVLSVIANKMPAEFIPTISWTLIHVVDPYTPIKHVVPRPKPIVHHLLIELEFINTENDRSEQLIIKITPAGKIRVDTTSLGLDSTEDLFHPDVAVRVKAVQPFVDELVSELHTPEE